MREFHQRRMTGVVAALIVVGTLITACSREQERVLQKPAIAEEKAGPLVVQTTNGALRGVEHQGVLEFRGVPYALPPVGERRFQKPQPPEKHTGVYDATQYGEAAVQIRAGAGAAAYPPEIGAAMAEAFASPEGLKPEGDENSLVLNVYTPATGDGGDRPVMVWLHGGGFSYGQAASKVYRGTYLARNHHVVVVGVNHRLNIFGFLALDSAGVPGFDGSANAGMLDIVMALRWVHDNIEAFGGDSDNVTIFGQSGGGAKVSTLLAMPDADGLFHKAIIQSGAGLSSSSTERAADAALQVLAALQIAPEQAAEVLPDLSTDEILAAANEVGSSAFRPSIDGSYIVRSPFVPDAPAQSAAVPLMVGFTKDERTLYNVGNESWYETTREQVITQAEQTYPGQGEALTRAYENLFPGYDPKYIDVQVNGTTRHVHSAYTLATRKAAQPAPVYTYVFTHDLPTQDSLLKSPHTAEIPYTMDNVGVSPLFSGTRDVDFKVEDIMSTTWTSFARTGNPNNEALPDWPEFTPDERETMFLSAEPEVVRQPYQQVWEIVTADRE